MLIILQPNLINKYDILQKSKSACDCMMEKQLIVLQNEQVRSPQGNSSRSTSNCNRKRPQSLNLARGDVVKENL